MDTREEHIAYVKAAEAQFRLATAARLASTMGHQPLDLPMQWAHGRHTVSYAEIALSKEEADFAAWNLQRSATFLMASAALEAIRAIIPDPKTSTDSNVANAYQIARMIRNAFAHSPFNPVWRIDHDCRNRVFIVPDVIEMNTTDLDGEPFDWRDYGGPLAILRLSQFVRRSLLGDIDAPAESIPVPQETYIQQGELILRRVSSPPLTAEP